MTTHSDSFVVHADYVPAGVSDLHLLITVILAYAGIGAGIVLYGRIGASDRSKSDTVVNVTLVFILVGIASLMAYTLIIGGMKSSPDIDTIITAPEDCAISSGTGIKSSDAIITVRELPEGQKRATFHVNATCKDAESLQQLLELDESIVPLDQQPVHAGVES